MKALQNMYSIEKEILLRTQLIGCVDLHIPIFNELKVRIDKALLAQFDPIDGGDEMERINQSL